MSRKPAKKMISAPVKKLPMAKKAAAMNFTSNRRNVRKLGLTPVAARAPTILSSSHLLPVPIAPVNVVIALVVSQTHRIFAKCNRLLRLGGIVHQPHRTSQTANGYARVVMNHSNHSQLSIVLDGEWASSYSRQVREYSAQPDQRAQPPPFSPAIRQSSYR